MRPIVEIQFSDFTCQAMDQIVNQAAKIHFMLGGAAQRADGAPRAARFRHRRGGAALAEPRGVVRARPRAEGRDAGDAADAKGLLLAAIDDPNPVIVLEHKLLYRTERAGPGGRRTRPARASPPSAATRRDLTIVATGDHGLPGARGRRDSSPHEGIEATVIDPRTLTPLDAEPIIDVGVAAPGERCWSRRRPGHVGLHRRDRGPHRRVAGVLPAAGTGTPAVRPRRAHPVRAAAGDAPSCRSSPTSSRPPTELVEEPGLMARIPIRMPKMSMTMTEGDVSELAGLRRRRGHRRRCRLRGDHRQGRHGGGEPGAGIISSILVESGTVDVGTPIAYIEGDDSGGFGDLLDGIGGDTGAVPDAATAAGETAASDSSSAVPDDAPTGTAAAGPAAAVPRARSLARDTGVDLGSVTGSGPDGLILMADVSPAASPTPESAPTPARVPSTPPVPAVAPPVTPAAAGDPPFRPQQDPGVSSGTAAPNAKRIALIRTRVAAKMVESAAVPQFTLWRDLILDAPNPRRERISWTTVLLSSYAAALRGVPELLCRWEDDGAVRGGVGRTGVGLAIATPYGLLVPVFAEPDVGPRPTWTRIRSVVDAAAERAARRGVPRLCERLVVQPRRPGCRPLPGSGHAAPGQRAVASARSGLVRSRYRAVVGTALTVDRRPDRRPPDRRRRPWRRSARPIGRTPSRTGANRTLLESHRRHIANS